MWQNEASNPRAHPVSQTLTGPAVPPEQSATKSWDGMWPKCVPKVQGALSNPVISGQSDIQLQRGGARNTRIQALKHAASRACARARARARVCARARACACAHVRAGAGVRVRACARGRGCACACARVREEGRKQDYSASKLGASCALRACSRARACADALRGGEDQSFIVASWATSLFPRCCSI